MNRVLRSISIITIAMVMTLEGSGITAFARVDEPQRTARQQVIQPLEGDAFDYVDSKSRRLAVQAEKNYPEKYDLRNADIDGDGVGDNRCFVTPVKLQNPFPTCWGFAAIAAAESSILSSLLKDDPDAYKWLDLSEKQLAYFTHMPINMPGFSQDGEGTYSDTSSAASIYIGGFSFLATAAFAAGIGPKMEVHDPASEDYIPELEYRGKHEYTEQRAVKGDYIDFSYSPEDDWSMDESLRFVQDYVLKESYFLPSPAGINTETRKYEYNEAGTAAIKDQLLKNRAVEISFAADTSNPNDEANENRYISKNWAHYTWNDNAKINHGVVIIGYDDNYPKENFLEDHQPEKDGAWLVKNSWGSGEVDFPNRGTGEWGIPVPKLDDKGNEVIENGEKVMVNSGYFWLSYYDKSLTNPEALSFDEQNETEGYVLDEYDLMPVRDVRALASGETLKTANVFSAEVSEKLYAVSCQTTVPNTKVSFDIYLLPDEFKSPEDGIRVAHEEGLYEYGGYHKKRLSSDVLVQKGQNYSIVVTQLLENGKYSTNIPFGLGPQETPKSFQVGIINEKESFAYIDGSWNDYSIDSVREYLNPFRGSTVKNDIAFDNFPIKGYAKAVPGDISMRLSGNNELLLYGDYDKTIFGLRFRGAGGYPLGKPNITWETTDGGDKVVSVTPSADKTKAQITAIGEGKTFLCVTVDGIGTSIVPITVENVKPGFIGFEDDQYMTYTGKAFRPEVDVYSTDEFLLIEGIHYNLSYKNNVKVGIGTVTATSAFDNKLSIRDYFVIEPAKAVVRKVTPGKKQLTVTVKDQKLSGITGYKIQYRIKGTSKWKSKTLKAGKTKLTIRKLKTGKKYEVRARGYYKIPKNPEEYEFDPETTGAYSKVKTSKKIK